MRQRRRKRQRERRTTILFNNERFIKQIQMYARHRRWIFAAAARVRSRSIRRATATFRGEDGGLCGFALLRGK
jgi:hypothetical protein